ncbi:TIGR01906 family membrane protein [Caldisalinibacter kiritimatiensis]|uniref:Integral membrane protein n=1 Tax=Caldisalinibacter kiritimatiensis TaxID=1304284 RepID=R1CXK3_9FIRM|nr:TIGR01906 family membrane protein [Caldisalinibacter kiritimatiensis]EOD01344.1 hypothetical protein L21TH_0565 [Caldisalinibacter kiritimatiensis]
MTKKIVIIMQVLFIIALPIVLIFTDVQLSTFDLDYYQKKYEEYNIMRKTGIEKDDLMYITEELLDYLRGDREGIKIWANVNGEKEQIFESREIAHLYDVKELFSKGFLTRNISLVILFLSFIFIIIYNRKSLYKTVIISCLIPLGIMLVMGILLATDFYKYFTYFHLILFDNDLWLLDPKTDILIQMYPLSFFNSIAYKIITMFLIELLAILTFGLILKTNRFIKKLNINR